MRRSWARHNRVAIITTTLITLVMILVLPLAVHVVGTIVDVPKPIVDFSGEWRLCFEKGDCISTVVPHKDYPGGRREDFHYLYYSKSFPTTKEIMASERSLIFTQIGEAAVIEINGTKIKTAGSLPPNFRYSAHYPVVATLSRDLLNPLGKMNEIKITAYTTKVSEAGLRGELNGVFDRVDAVRYQEGKLLYDITAPIFAALLLLALAYYALRVALKFSKLRKIFWSYLWATLAAALFLVNYSKLTNEFLPAWLVSHMHFLFRNLMDWTLLYFFLNFYSREPARGPWQSTAPKARKIISVFGHSVFGILTILILSSLIIQALLSDSSIQATLGASLPHAISGHLSYFRIFPLLVGALGCLIDTREKLWGRVASAVGMLFIIALQIHDIIGYSAGSTGIYFVKVFPLFVMYFFFTKINEIREDYIAEDAKVLSEAKTEVLVKRRIAHDLKHPILELRNFAREMTDPMLKVKVKKLVADLSEMNQSLDGKVEFSTKLEPTLVSSLVEQVVESARNRFKDFDVTLALDPSCIGVFSKLNPTEFSHVLSNVIANATESYEEEEGEIRIALRLHPSSKRLELRVSDFGRGIDEKTQKNLFKEGATFGKIEGRGQGLFQARKTLENWGGSAQLFSRAGEGTSVLLSLPEAPAPLHFARSLDLSQSTDLIVVSDNPSQMLFDRVAAFAPNVKVTILRTVTSAEDFVSGLTDIRKAKTTWVVAGAMKRATSFSGVDFILKHGLQKLSVLHLETDGDASFVKAKENKIGILLSSLIQTICIEAKVIPGHELHILIDNDLIVRKRWEKSAINKGLRFQAFSSIKGLRSELHLIPVDTKIFVDADIDGNFDGLGLAAELQEKGYSVTLATGYAKHALPPSASKFKLIGKTPPWVRGVPV